MCGLRIDSIWLLFVVVDWCNLHSAWPPSLWPLLVGSALRASFVHIVCLVNNVDYARLCWSDVRAGSSTRLFQSRAAIGLCRKCTQLWQPHGRCVRSCSVREWPMQILVAVAARFLPTISSGSSGSYPRDNGVCTQHTLSPYSNESSNESLAHYGPPSSTSAAALASLMAEKTFQRRIKDETSRKVRTSCSFS